MFWWPCIIVYQYNETNVIHFSFSLLRIKSLYMFRALLAHPQKSLHKQHLVYCVKLQPCHNQLTLYTRSTPNAICAATPEDEQVMFETCRGLWFLINWMKVHHDGFMILMFHDCKEVNFSAFLWTSNSTRMDVAVFPIFGLYGALVSSSSQHLWR
jgi:hypothetical protein